MRPVRRCVCLAILMCIVISFVSGATERSRGVERDYGKGKDGRERGARSVEQMATDIMRAATEGTIPEPYSGLSRHLADPVGVLFSRFHDAFYSHPRGSRWWVGGELESFLGESLGSSMESEIGSSLHFAFVDENIQRGGEGSDRMTAPGVNERVEGQSEREKRERDESLIKRSFGHGFTVARKAENDGETPYQGRRAPSWPPWAKRALEEEMPIHVPLNSAEEDCNGRGVMQGDVENICERQDCAVTALRCPPDYDLLDPSNYTLANLTACQVESVQCMHSTLFFADDATRIKELLCEDGSIVGPDEGDLDHCSVLTLFSGALVLNFTLADDYDDKCFVEYTDCPAYCDELSLQCGTSPLVCEDEFLCVDDQIHCSGEVVTCQGSPILCDDEDIVICEDHYPHCSDFSLLCHGQSLCADGEVTCREEDGLALCNGDLALCDDVVIACADTERTLCHDVARHTFAYAPLLECDDSLENCTALYVSCDNAALACEEGSTWVFNATLIDIPFCLRDDLLGTDLFDYYDDRDEDDAEVVVVTAAEMCRGGDLGFHCTMDTCENVTITCDFNTDLYCPPESLFTIENPNDVHSIAFCDGNQLVCHSQAECPLARLPCEDEQECSSLVYECDEIKTANCTYKRYPCVDACWVIDGEWSCACPIDFTGSKCGGHRDYSCDIELLSPQPHCEPFEDPDLRKLDSDPVCLLFSVNDMLTFSYKLDCRFEELEGLNETETFEFEYYARRGNEFAKSFAEVPYQASLRVFDFSRLSDLTKSQFIDLTPGQLVDGDAFLFDLDVNHIYASATYKPRYFFGGRMYIEAALFDMYGRFYSPPGLVQRKADAQFLDFYDFVADDQDAHVPGPVLYILQVAFAPTLFLMVFMMLSGVIYFVKQRQFVEDSYRQSVTD